MELASLVIRWPTTNSHRTFLQLAVSQTIHLNASRFATLLTCIHEVTGLNFD
jgi:hypothetical protein